MRRYRYGWIIVAALIWGSITFPADARERWTLEQRVIAGVGVWWQGLSGAVKRLLVRGNGDLLSPPKPQPATGEEPPLRPERTLTVE